MANNTIAVQITASDKTQAAFASAKRGMDAIVAQSGRFNAAFAAFGRGFGLSMAGAAAGVVAFTKTTIDAADNLNDLAKKSGASVEALASLKLISEQSGTSIEAVGKGMNKLSI